jgi:hypothetical protein
MNEEMCHLLNRVAASVDRGSPPDNAVELRLRSLFVELRRHCVNTDVLEDTLSELVENSRLVAAALVSGGQLHTDMSMVFEGTASGL